MERARGRTATLVRLAVAVVVAGAVVSGLLFPWVGAPVWAASPRRQQPSPRTW